MILQGFALLFLALILFLIYLVLQARRNYGTLEKMGIPVIPPHPILGSFPRGYLDVSHLADQERSHQYGGIYGVSPDSNTNSSHRTV